jgi:hypothetical protein
MYFSFHAFQYLLQKQQKQQKQQKLQKQLLSADVRPLPE